MNALLPELIIGVCIIIGWIIFTLYRMISKKGFVPVVETEKTKRNVDPRIVGWRQKNKKIIDRTMIIFLWAFLTPAIIWLLIPFILDLKFIISQQYPEFEGEIISDIGEGGTRNLRQDIILKSDITNEKLHISLAVGKREKGDWVYIEYLPNLKIGNIIE